VRRAIPGFVLAISACATPAPPDVDPGLESLALSEVHPGTILPGSAIDLVGADFVDEREGLARLSLKGTFTPDGGGPRDLSVELLPEFVDESHLRVPATADAWSALGGAAGAFDGTAQLAIDSALDHRRHPSPPIPVAFKLARAIAPKLDTAAGGMIYVNSPIAVAGDGFLFGGAEGETRAVLDGCFLAAGDPGPCAQKGRFITGAQVVARPAAPWDRQHAVFPFAPAIAGIHPGTFTGTVKMRNVYPNDPSSLSAPVQVTETLLPPTLTEFSPAAASLGQYVDVTGGGFAGGEPGAVTLLHLVGQFIAEGANMAAPVDLELVPRFVDGGRLRYVLDEADELGHLVDLRQIAGAFHGTAEVVVIDGKEQELGAPIKVSLAIAHVKQIVYVNFARSFQQSMRLYGLAAAAGAVRDRIMVVAARDYAGVNVEYRATPPQDFALFAQVDVLGPDPNALGLLGYDNTPGKDVGNTRLFDRIGGVNATTQQDGFPGYGGVFAENFLGFSAHPPSTVMKLPFETDGFDAIFDPLRPDRGGRAVSPVEALDLPALTDGSSCPAGDRRGQIACAVFVLGNLIGTTMTHETGHSLGLANPYGDGFHDVGDLPNRLMEAGGDRPFEERAELKGQGPALFCDSEFDYLRMILPAPPESDPHLDRPPCE
jgi:hypothetical protein